MRPTSRFDDPMTSGSSAGCARPPARPAAVLAPDGRRRHRREVGREIRIGDQWLADFASCNYLGFDLDPEIIDAVRVPPAVGHPPQLVAAAGQPAPLRGDRGAPHRAPRGRGHSGIPTITHIHTSVIPVLAGEGTVFLDAQAHKTIYDGAVARGPRRDGRPLPPQRPEGARAAHARRRPRRPVPHRDGRRELDDRQRPRPGGIRPDLPRVRRAAVRRRRPRLRCHRGGRDG